MAWFFYGLFDFANCINLITEVTIILDGNICSIGKDNIDCFLHFTYRYARILSAQNQNGTGGAPPPMSSGGMDCA